MPKPHATKNLFWLLLKPKNFVYLVGGFAFGSILLILTLTSVWLTTLQTQNLQSQAVNTAYICSQINQIPNAECQALYQLYERTTGESWVFSSNEVRWFSTNQPCDWTGISCDSSPRITHINLNSKNLKGNLPPTIWGSLAFLKTLDLSANQFLSGSLPEDIKYVILDTLKTKDSNLCLPSQLDAWYLEIENTDEIFDCDGYINPLKSCNQDCSSNSECENNLLCYTIGNAQKCRLADNPSDDQCRKINDGLDFTCNHYCADTSECADGLSCWYNRCRQPENVESESCTPPAAKLKSLMEQNCNQKCSSNKDCVINMRCYQGACRLATHPENSRCQPVAPVKPVQTKIVQKIVVLEPTPVVETKRSTQEAQASKEASMDQDSTTSAESKVTPEPSLTPIMDQKTKSDGGELTSGLGVKLQAIIESLSGANTHLSQEEKTQNTKLGLILLGGGVVILIVAKLLAGKTKKPQNQLTRDHTNTAPPPSSMIHRLKEKNITPPQVKS